MISFSFIVLFHNNSGTDRVIDSLLRESMPGDEIIVIDDHSHPDQLRIFDRFGDSIRLLHSDRIGNRAYNRNYGASFAKNDFFLFVDGDMVFLPNAVSAMRVSMESGYVGAVGNIIRSGTTPAQMDILTGIDYLNILRTELSAEQIIQLGLFFDKRQSSLYEKIAVDSLWEYFYSGYCAVNRGAFEEVGGFETTFSGWGVEDDELGYRLHLKGKLDYNSAAYAVHIPYERDLYQCLLSNRVSMYRFLEKTPTNEIELHMTFGNTPKSWHTLECIRRRVLAEHTTLFDFPDGPNRIFVNEMTEEHPFGHVRFTSSDAEIHSLELLGLALPFRNKNFEIGFCSTDLFIYPEFLSSTILGELLRISMEVRILKVDSPRRINWTKEQLTSLGRTSSYGRVVYLPLEISDFDIEDCGLYYRIRDGVAAKLNDHFLVEENYYMPELFEHMPPQYLLLNLTGVPAPEGKRTSLEQQYHIQIHDCYNLDVCLSRPRVALSQVLAGDLYRLHIPIIYLLPEGIKIDRTDLWWRNPFRQRDIIAQNT